MTNKTPAIISSILTVILLILFAVVSVFMQMIGLNGVSESQGVGIILAGMFAGWLTNLVVTKFDWNKILAVIIAMIAGVMMGGTISFVLTIISIPMAGIR